MRLLTASFLPWLAALLYLPVLVVVHLVPIGSFGLTWFETNGFRTHHLAHIVAFFPWGGLLIWTYWSLSKRSFLRAAGIIVIGITVAVGIECLQLLTPHRSFNPNDILYNLTGTLIGAIAGARLRRARGARSSGHGA